MSNRGLLSLVCTNFRRNEESKKKLQGRRKEWLVTYCEDTRMLQTNERQLELQNDRCRSRLYLVIFHANPCNYDFFGILQNPIVPKEEAADAKVSTNFDRKFFKKSLKSFFFYLSANLFYVRENTFSFKTLRLTLKCSIQVFELLHRLFLIFANNVKYLEIPLDKKYKH